VSATGVRHGTGAGKAVVTGRRKRPTGCGRSAQTARPGSRVGRSRFGRRRRAWSPDEQGAGEVGRGPVGEAGEAVDEAERTDDRPVEARVADDRLLGLRIGLDVAQQGGVSSRSTTNLPLMPSPLPLTAIPAKERLVEARGTRPRPKAGSGVATALRPTRTFGRSVRRGRLSCRRKAERVEFDLRRGKDRIVPGQTPSDRGQGFGERSRGEPLIRGLPGPGPAIGPLRRDPATSTGQPRSACSPGSARSTTSRVTTTRAGSCLHRPTARHP
jgi:hypothetical protein